MAAQVVRSARFPARDALPAWASEPCVMGIDEAGRGPSLGPMVYGVAVCRVVDVEYLANQKYADSKTLAEEKREALFKRIQADEKLLWAVDVISAAELSAKMLSRDKVSLNTISFDSAMGLIQQALDNGINLSEVFVDTVGDPARYQEILSKRFAGIKFVVCPKADAIYPIVSAASIAAKVTRDNAMRDWVFEPKLTEISRAMGSGYPSDPNTQQWMMDNMQKVFGFPEIARFSWANTKLLLDTQAIAAVQWEAELEDDMRSNQKLGFGGVPVSDRVSTANDRHSYFKSRKLQRVVCF